MTASQEIALALIATCVVTMIVGAIVHDLRAKAGDR